MDIERNRIAGKCLRRFRKEAGLTQTELAKRLNKSQSFVSKVENAEREISLVEIYFYAEALDAGYTVVVKEIHSSLDEAGLNRLDPKIDQADTDEPIPCSPPEE